MNIIRATLLSYIHLIPGKDFGKCLVWKCNGQNERKMKME